MGGKEIEIILAVFVSLYIIPAMVVFVLIYIRAAKHAGQAVSTASAAPVKEPRIPVVGPPESASQVSPVAEILNPEAFTGDRRRILIAHAAAYRSLAQKTGKTGTPQATVRDLLVDTVGLSPVLCRAFNELTGLAEKALYSECEFGTAEAVRAEQLREEVVQGLSRPE